MNKILASSTDPKQLSMSIKGALILIVPLAALVIKAAGGEVENEQLENVIDIIADIVYFAGSILSLGTMLLGAVRKIASSFK